MVSAIGLTGGSSRCFPEWQSFLECYTASSTSDVTKCQAKSADYYECLHHKKEKGRAILIANEMLKRKDEEGKLLDVVKKQFSIDSLGLVKE
ncbi:uncharacterized protein SAPINGB_P003923 [Magnusiomyces paraingens]|uniref:NADH dehydrogenase [ubiquinone] iron-sulfur protein 5 n=1 Tax=Magnusiomyces paraingens TaxID=2606893 RepID=A0A5E8BRY9_9ASCO|nr:uncharacterized protein SAPINGB_P003923 [Saprochaete ingens]VVT54133.1 unnamed protein product [Saprochaete ingens]